MERLQAAVEKARAQRQSSREAAAAAAAAGNAPQGTALPEHPSVLQTDAGALEQAGGLEQAGLPETAATADLAEMGRSEAGRPDMGRSDMGRSDMGRAPAEDRADASAARRAAAWQALRPFEAQTLQLRRNRIVTFEGGPDSTPYDLLRTKITHQAQLNGWRRIAVVSSHSGCGKTTTTANLAFSLSRQKDLRSLVIDLDLRRPALGQLLGQASRFNMADVLERRVSFAEHGERYGTNIAFGFNNESVRNPSEILQSQQARDVLAETEDIFGADLVLFDMPPMMASDDNFGFLKNVDAALLIAAAEKTPVSEIDVTERQLAALTNVMGIVLNKCNYVNGAYGYEYDYY